MKIESKIELFTQGEVILHFVVGISGFIMKELGNEFATVYGWECIDSANEFISSKFPKKQWKLYEIKSLNKSEFDGLNHTIKFLPENAEVNVELYKST